MKLKKLLILILMFVMATFAIFAQKNTVAVVPFDHKGVSADDAETLTELFTSEYAAATNVTVVDRVNFDKIIAQMKFELTDWSNNEKVAELGKALNANLVLCGQVRTLGNKITLNVRVINVNSTAIVSSVTGSSTEITGFLDEMPVMVNKMAMKPTSRIGDIGPGGGIVFYESDVGFPVKQEDGSEKICHYLEVSQLEVGKISWCACPYGNSQWCNVSTSDGLGAGLINTANIINAFHGETNTTTNCAAYACSKYYTQTTQQGEWYLPSKTELDLLYRNLRDKVISTGSDGWHWSSSEVNYYNGAWRQRFSDGTPGDSPKDNPYSVRAVRAF